MPSRDFPCICIFPCLIIVIRNGKIVWENGPCCRYSRLNLKYLGWLYKAYIKTAKNCDFCDEMLSEKDFEHSHKKRKDSLEKQAVLLMFSLELEISGVAIQSIHQNSQKWWLCQELLSENDFEAVLVTFCCYEHDIKASEAVQKIATDQKEYRKSSFCVIICWIVEIYLSIKKTVKKGCLLGQLRHELKSCRGCIEKEQ